MLEIYGDTDYLVENWLHKKTTMKLRISCVQMTVASRENIDTFEVLKQFEEWYKLSIQTLNRPPQKNVLMV